MSVSFYNFCRPQEKDFFRRVIRFVLLRERKKGQSLSLVAVTKAEMERLNRQYRRENRATDVLSFAGEEPGYLGEVILCREQARQNAREYAWPLQKELTRLVIHGLLHLLGYEHEQGGRKEREMIKLQEKYLSAVLKQN